MYTNIDTNHAPLRTISHFLRDSTICCNIDINPDNSILSTLSIIMQHNVFTFDSCFWVQLTGTAMGTPPAPTYATIYFASPSTKYRQFQPFLISFSTQDTLMTASLSGLPHLIKVQTIIGAINSTTPPLPPPPLYSEGLVTIWPTCPTDYPSFLASPTFSYFAGFNLHYRLARSLLDPDLRPLPSQPAQGRLSLSIVLSSLCSSVVQ